MRCTIFGNGGWKTEVVACLSPASGQRIPINTTLRDSSGEWRCQQNEGGAVTLLPASYNNGVSPAFQNRPLNAASFVHTAWWIPLLASILAYIHVQY
ncbi:hypothetical protein AAVH_31238 [Aphelenchoides avenae]|nr:hypothetical protein AAVH_31238 [Aphelenchus avenae]